MIEFHYGALKGIARLPKAFKKGEKYPAILFLHGAGTRGCDLEVLKNNQFFNVTGEYEDFPFISIAPQCHTNSWFELLCELISLVKAMSKATEIDNERIYLMGNSMGGYGTWQLAMSCPEYFAAIVPICGGGMYWNAARLMYLPVWAHHGDRDPVVYPEESIKMVEAINQKGGDAKITLYERCGHDAWTPTFKNYGVFEWMLSKKNLNNPASSENFSDERLYG